MKKSSTLSVATPATMSAVRAARPGSAGAREAAGVGGGARGDRAEQGCGDGDGQRGGDEDARGPQRRPAALGLAAMLAAATTEEALQGGGDLVFAVVTFASPWLIGRGVREQRRQESALADAVARLERERERNAALAVAAGSVDAAVDFAGLGRSPGAVRVSDDHKEVAITLPPARLTDAGLDPERSRVHDRDCGALDRIEEAISDDGGADQQELYVLAEDKLTEAAASDPKLLQTAERNTRSVLEGMMRGLGFENVIVRFERPKV